MNFVGIFRDGKTLSEFALDRRVAIKKKCYANPEISDQTPAGAEEVKQLSSTMQDPSLRMVSGRIIYGLLQQHVKFQLSRSGRVSDVIP